MQSLTQATVVSQAAPQSTFVTVIAWVFIVGAAFCTFIAILQALAFTFVMPEAHFWSNPGPPRGIENLPKLAQFVIGNVKAFFIASWVIFVVTLIAAVGLLRRKNWARLYFVTVLSLGIAWNVLALFTQHEFLDGFVQANDKMPVEFAQRFETMRIAMSVFSAIWVVAISVVFGWIVKRLLSKSVRAEFNAL